MSILIDDREDPSLADHLSRFGLPTSVIRLDFGDLAIQSGDGLLIGYERKRPSDLVNSMQDRRLSGHQLKNMWRCYDRVELIVEGLWRPGEHDELEVFTGKLWRPLFHRGSGVSFRQVDSFLYSQYECGGVPHWRTGGTVETSHLLASRYHWWQKDYDLHKSVEALYTNNPSVQKRGAVLRLQGEPNAVTLMAAQIPGIDAKAWDVGRHFNNPTEMIEANVAEWRRVEWIDRKGNVKHFGPDTSREIVRWLRGEKT